MYDHGLAQKYNFFDPSWRVPHHARPWAPSQSHGDLRLGIDITATIRERGSPSWHGYDLHGGLSHQGVSPRPGGVAAALLQGLALVTSSWKLVFYLDDGKGQLFSRAEDPRELTNLFDEQSPASVRAKLMVALLRWRAGLEPIGWLQQHDDPSRFADSQVAYKYTMSRTGREPEEQLQADVLGL